MPSNSQPEDERGSKSPDSGHESDDNVKPKSTTPPRSTSKVEKPPISPKPVNSKTKCEASPAAQANNVDPTNSEMQKPSHSVREISKRYGEQAQRYDVQATRISTSTCHGSR